ncbi:uncharacterized protein LOC125560614 [Nematostella vectensis]|uniref:uncharacterized protein LOC125560614 n=1 Tax=Nematostella vectensis TaxID=45351 RepID=UPI002076F563|nr:uncharacterized protein LOC125560614 [Nematostella vectensis]
MLGTLEVDKKKDWPDYVTGIVHAYNATKHLTTGYSPSYLMFGRNPRLPQDVTLGPDPVHDPQPYAAYIENLRDKLTDAYSRAQQEIEKKAEANKRRYDALSEDLALQPGDRVLVRNLKHKLQDRWEDVPYRVVRRSGEQPVCVVQHEQSGKKRVLHFNILLPYRAERAGPEPRKQHGRKYPPRRQQEDDTESSASDSHSSWLDFVATELNPLAVPFTMDEEGEEPEVHIQQEYDNDVQESESGGEAAEKRPDRLRPRRVVRPPARLICDPVWSQQVSTLNYGITILP